MGGKKKIGLKQMERMQSKNDKEQSKKEKKEKAPVREKKTTINVIPPDAKNAKLVAEVKKMNVLTPYAISTKYNVRISAAKQFLSQLEENGAVQLVSGSHNIKVYKPNE